MATNPPENSSETRPPATRKRSRRSRLIRLAIRIAVFGGLLFYLLTQMDSYFYYPSRDMILTPAEFNLPFEPVRFPTRDGLNLAGWWLPARGDPLGTVVHFHGNAENISTHVSFVTWLPEAGFNVLVFDYRGYGESEGSISRAGTILDGHAALDYVHTRPDVDPQRVFVFGQSIGGAVAIATVADRNDVVALVVDSTFSGYRRIASLHLERMLGTRYLAVPIATALISTRYDPLDHVADLAPRPLLIIAAGGDTICFPELSEELYAAAAEPKELWVLPGLNHIDALWAEPDRTKKRITEWFLNAAAASPLPENPQ